MSEKNERKGRGTDEETKERYTLQLNLTRRRFVARGALGLASLPLLGGLASCATALVHSAAPTPEGRVRISLRDLPELAEAGGVAVVHVTGEEAPIFVVRTGDREYLALSSVCTHRGCTVEATTNGFACPCHGSRYGKAGEVVRGPAQRNLRRLTTSLGAEGTLEVLLRGGAAT